MIQWPIPILGQYYLYITNSCKVFEIGEYFNLEKIIRLQSLPLGLFFSFLYVTYSKHLLLWDFLPDEALGDADALRAASGVSISDRMSVMLSSPAGTGDPGSGVVVVGGIVLLAIHGLRRCGPVSVVPDSNESE